MDWDEQHDKLNVHIQRATAAHLAKRGNEPDWVESEIVNVGSLLCHVVLDIASSLDQIQTSLQEIAENGRPFKVQVHGQPHG